LDEVTLLNFEKLPGGVEIKIIPNHQAGDIKIESITTNFESILPSVTEMDVSGRIFAMFHGARLSINLPPKFT
jgi:hypothetical protein